MHGDYSNGSKHLPEGFGERKHFLTIFHYCTHGIKARGPKMFKCCYPITEEGGVLIPPYIALQISSLLPKW